MCYTFCSLSTRQSFSHQILFAIAIFGYFIRSPHVLGPDKKREKARFHFKHPKCRCLLSKIFSKKQRQSRNSRVNQTNMKQNMHPKLCEKLHFQTLCSLFFCFKFKWNNHSVAQCAITSKKKKTRRRKNKKSTRIVSGTNEPSCFLSIRVWTSC